MSDAIGPLYWNIVIGAFTILGVFVALLAFRARGKLQTRTKVTLSILAILLLLAGVGGFIYDYSKRPPQRLTGTIESPTDRSAIERVVEESQLFENLVMYKDPKRFESAYKSQMRKYWFPGSSEEKAVMTSVRGMAREGSYYCTDEYGREPVNKQFKVEFTRIYVPGDLAEVQTLEEWFLPTCASDGKTTTLNRNPMFGPYRLIYKLQKLNGEWLIYWSNTPRMPVKPLPKKPTKQRSKN